MAQTLLWYDLETFGVHPRWDRVGQFAAIRTNYRFEPVGDPICIFCRLSPDYIPDPDSCLVTGLTPRIVNEKGMSEADFADAVHREMTVPGTCVVGYNNIRFDDEFVRNLFYRNFYDPYRREYDAGNSRWDILDLVRMTHDLRPEGISWLHDEEGKPSFRLEELTAANEIGHERAHDALSDVRATIGLAALLQEKQPKLFRYHFKLRKKEEVRRLLNLQSPRPVVHTSGMFTRPGGCTSVVYPLSVHPSRTNEIIVYDLRFDPRTWMDLEVKEIRRRVFTRTEDLDGVERVRFKSIHLNRSPAVAPLNTLTPARAEVLGLDVNQCALHARLLRERSDLVQKVRAVYTQDDAALIAPRDPELQIYSGGFFGDEDRETFEVIHHTDAKELILNSPRFVDSRGPELLRRYLARNHFDLLSDAERSRWISYCASRLLAPELDSVVDYGRFRRQIENMLSRTDTKAAQKTTLRDLRDYADWIEANILHYG